MLHFWYVCVCVWACVCVCLGWREGGGGGELASGSYIPAFPQLLLFFSFAPAFDTSSLSKGGPISSGLMVVAVSSEENNSLKNSAVKFTCPSSNPTIFPSLSLMTSGFFRCFWFDLFHGLMTSIWVIFVFLNFVFFYFESVLNFLQVLVALPFQPDLLLYVCCCLCV